MDDLHCERQGSIGARLTPASLPTHRIAWPATLKETAAALANGDMASLPFPIERPEPVNFHKKYEIHIRHLLSPAARCAQRLGLLQPG